MKKGKTILTATITALVATLVLASVGLVMTQHVNAQAICKGPELLIEPPTDQLFKNPLPTPCVPEQVPNPVPPLKSQ